MITRPTLVFLAAIAALSFGASSSVSAAPVPTAPQSAKKPEELKLDPKKLEDSHELMKATLKDILDRTDAENFLLGGYKMRNMEQILKNLSNKAPRVDRFRLLIELGKATVYYGEERKGLDYFKQAFEMGSEEIPEDIYNESKINYAEAWMRLAETENCCASHNSESCILPFQGPAIHTKKEGSTNAIKWLGDALDSTAKSSPIHLRALWMYNMAHMTLGDYPKGVPKEHLIPEAFFSNKGEFKKFQNVAGDVGVDYLNLAGGAIADDFDNDHDLDLVFSGYGSGGQLEYFRNDGGTFSHQTAHAGLVGIYGGLSILHADYDNDGFLDIYVPRGAWLSEIGLQPDSLLHNNGDGTFTDVAFAVGLNEKYYPNVTACFTDIDNDGDLDLYVGNEQDKFVVAPCQLFRNDGVRGAGGKLTDVKFTEITAAAGVSNDRYTRAVSAGDYDGDGYPDLYCSNLGEDNRLYHNNGDGTFTDVAPEAGVVNPQRSYPVWFFDYNNDGLLDIEIMAFGARPQDLAACALGLPYDADLPSLHLNLGNGKFKDIGVESGLTEPFSVMGAQVGDFDNDGFLDFYGGTGRPEARDLVPDKAYRNKRGKGYEDITYHGGFGNLQKGHGRSFADLDSDGDLDVVAQMGGAFRSDLFYNSLYENPGFENNWIAMKLIGVKSNRCAIGARVRADFVETTGEGEEKTVEKRSVYRWVDAGSSFGANPLRVHIGIGKAVKIDTLEITWPTSKTTQTFKDVAINQFLHITEGAEAFEVIPQKPVKLGGDKH